MIEKTGLFNHRVAKNFIPLPGFQVPSVGDIAPDFTLPQVNGPELKLSDYRNKQTVILAFTRIFTEKLFCPFCYPHIQALKEYYQDFREKRVELLMISSTDPLQSQKIVSDLELPYPFLFDPNCITFRRYGVGQALGAPLPAQYIINQEGRIIFRHLFSFIDSNAGPESLLTALENLSSKSN